MLSTTGDAFTCEPVHQSVHRIDLSADGHGYVGKRGDEEHEREFLSSTDRWFRPVQARTGPDGALWVADMYRYVIEHSRWIPQVTRDQVDVYAGQGRGRIYRVLPRRRDSAGEDVAVVAAVLLDLKQRSSSELVGLLSEPNGTLRDLAHQLLLWRSADDVLPDILQIIAGQSSAEGVVHAMSLLTAFGAVHESDLLAALSSKNAHVLRNSVRMSEPFLNTSPKFRTAVLRLSTHDNVRVRRQVALSVGVITSADAAHTFGFVAEPE